MSVKDVLWTNGLKRIVEPVSAFVSAVINGILLLIVYIIGVGITSIVGKIAGKEFLRMKSQRKTYWVTFESRGGSDQYYRMH